MGRELADKRDLADDVGRGALAVVSAADALENDLLAGHLVARLHELTVAMAVEMGRRRALVVTLRIAATAERLDAVLVVLQPPGL